MKIWIRNLALASPKPIRSRVLRRFIEFPREIDPNLCFKVAETREELEAAFGLLHDAYVKEGFMRPHPSGMRVTKYHALPSTSTLIIKEKNEVVGTVSLVRQNPFGLPLEAIFSLDKLPRGSRVAEVSSLAIKNGMQHQRGRLLFPLLRFMHQYATEYFGVSHLVIAVNPKWYTFYESILLFEPLASKPVERYEFVNGAPAMGGILDLRSAPRLYGAAYGNAPVFQNLAYFFTELEVPSMEFPLRKKNLISDPVLTPELMRYFFCERTKVFEQLNDFERSMLRNLYPTSQHRELIPLPAVTPLFNRKNRLEVRLDGRVFLPDGRSTRLEVHNLCPSGLGGYTSEVLPQGSYRIQLNLEDHQPCEIEGEIRWSDERGDVGVEVIMPPQAWKQFYDELNKRILVGAKKVQSHRSAA